MLIASKAHVVRQDVEDSDHLTEDEDTVAVHLEASEKLVEQHKLARVHNDALEGLFLVLRDHLSTVE